MINQVKKTLSKNYFLKLLIEGDYRWVRAGVMVAIIYYIIGVGLSISSSLLVDFLFSRYIYVLLVSIIVCLSVARWYPKALAEILSSTPDAFDVKSNVILQIIENWLPLIQLPITLFGGLALAVFAGYLSLFKSAVLGLPTDIPYWLLIYYTILIVICGIMMGGGIIVYLATMILFNKLFQFNLKLSHYRKLMPLSNFSAGLAVLAPAAVALLMILVFKDIRINSIIVAIIGTLGGVLMFATAQLSYQKAVSRAKQTYLKTLSDKYENYYQMVLDESNPRKLQEAKEGIGALEVIEKNIKAIPNWLIDLSDTQKIVWSSLAPIGSLFLSQVLKFLGLN